MITQPVNFESAEIKKAAKRGAHSAADAGELWPSTTVSAAEEQDNRDMMRLAAGHDAALNDLMERHAERLYQFLARALQSPDDAADLAQETFVRVHQSRKEFNGRTQFSTWLYAIASHLLSDHYRRRARHPRVSLEAGNEASSNEWCDSPPDPNASLSETAQTQNRVAAVRNAVAALPEQVRIPLLLAAGLAKLDAQVQLQNALGSLEDAVQLPAEWFARASPF